MSDFSSTLRKLAERNLTGPISKLGKVEQSDGFIRVGVTINRNAVNKMFKEMGFKVLEKKYEVLRNFARNLAYISPVYTGYYVNAWQVNTGVGKAITSMSTSAEPFPVAPLITSGSFKRKNKKSEGEAIALRENVADKLDAKIQEKFLETSIDITTIRDTWAFYNIAPYADIVNSKHGVIDGAALATGL